MRIGVRVTPKAARERVVEEAGVLKVYVTVAPEDGKANKAVIELLAKHWDVAKSRIEIVQGLTGRDKVVVIR